jgi:hypothetical protein
MREAPRLSVGTEGSDLVHIKVTIVAEERLALTRAPASGDRKGHVPQIAR